MAKQYDWEAIETEYVTTDISQRDLADKWGVSMNTLSQYARKLNWVEKRREYTKKLVSKAVQKTCNREANNLAKILSSVISMEDIASAKLAQDADQFNRWIVQDRNVDGSTVTSEVILDKIDTKAMSDLAKTLASLEKLEKSLRNIMTPREVQQMEIERERFELEKQKFELEKKKLDDLSDSQREVEIVFKNMEEGWDE